VKTNDGGPALTKLERDSIATWSSELPTERLRSCLNALVLWRVVVPSEGKKIRGRIDAMLKARDEGAV
jgi:hypothetical protein